MARRLKLTDKGVAALKPRAKRYAVSDPAVPGHWIRVQPSGSKTYAVIMRGPGGKQVLHTIGATTLHTLDEAELDRIVVETPPTGEAWLAIHDRLRRAGMPG